VNPNLQVQGSAGLAAVGAGEEKAYIDTEGIENGAAIRVSGRTGHSNWLALTLVMLLPLNLYWFQTAKRPGARLLIGLAVLAELAALVFTFTRMGALVGAAVVLFLVLKNLVRLTPARLSVLAIAAMVAWVLLPNAYKERVFSFADKPEMKSTEARIVLQEYAWQYTQDAPLLGVGISGYGLRFVNEDHWLAANLRWLIKERNWEALYYGPHNLYLQLAAETGFPGLIFMLAAFLILMVQLQRTQNALRGLEELELARWRDCCKSASSRFSVAVFFCTRCIRKFGGWSPRSRLRSVTTSEPSSASGRAIAPRPNARPRACNPSTFSTSSALGRSAVRIRSC
jgi:hypothetical protein